MSTGWSWYVIALIVLNIGGCAWLLWWTAKRNPGDPAPEETSHVWDGDITEYNKPLPRWWINLFYLTIVFSLGYLVWYGGWGAYEGYSRWSSANEHAIEKEQQDAKLNETFALFKDKPLVELARDPQAMKIGRSIYGNTCATCHGSTAQGAKGYPNLSDEIWHWGGEPETVLTTVLDGREGVMPEWGKVLTGIGGEHAVDSVVAYLRVIGDGPDATHNDYMAAQGKRLYGSVCAACHGVEGKGNPAMGAPDLTDEYWMYGDSKESLRETIANGRHGSMPAHRELLGETRARLVAAYVWSLSNPAPAGAPQARTAAP